MMTRETSTLFVLVVVVVCASFVYWLMGVIPFLKSSPFRPILQGCVVFVVLLWVLYKLFFLLTGHSAPSFV